MTRKIRGALLLLTLLCLLGGSARAGEGAGPERILLSWTGSPETTMTVSWQTEPGEAGGWAEYGMSPSLSDGKKVPVAAVKIASGIELGAAAYQAEISGLTPGTTYFYRVGNGEARSGIRRFETASGAEPSFSFLYMGDIHIGVEDDGKWKALLNSAAGANPGLAFGIFGGDMVDSGISAPQWKTLLDDASGVFSRIPLMPVSGNHESNFPGGKPELYLDLMALPQNGPEGFKEEFYSYDYGDCHVLVLNSWVFSGEQKLGVGDDQRINRWIAEDLRSSRAAWKIVVMHHPVYSLASDKVAAAVRRNWEPLFEANGVSLVLCGHQHVYSRSYPMTDGRIDFEDGVTYVMGNASQKFYSSADETYQVKTIYNISTYQIVRIDGDTLSVQSFDGAGNLLDFTSLSPRRVHTEFSDVAAGAWYSEPVSRASSMGLLRGTGADSFSPGAAAARSTAVLALYRLAGSPAVTGTAPFSDVPPAAVYADAAAWARETGVYAGTDAGLFLPKESLTRERLCAMLRRYAEKINGQDTAAEGNLAAFSDSAALSPQACADLAWAVNHGLIQGTKDGRLTPEAPLSRAQTAAILARFTEGGTKS